MKRLVFVLLTSLMAMPFPALAQSRELGTLFFTPSERSHLDKLRRGENIATGESADPVLNGYIRRSDGVNTVWINGAPFKVDAKRLENIDSLPVGTSASVEIRAGSGNSTEPVPRKAKSK